MDRQERIDLILDHHDRPRHRGALPGAQAVYTGGNPGCGDVITVYLAVNSPDQVVKLSFEGKGCTISQASASMLLEMLNGKLLQEVEEATPAALLTKLGPDIAKARERCATLAFTTVKNAYLEYKRSVRPSVTGPICEVRTTALKNIDDIRANFPILQRSVNGHPLAYLDNAATSQKPQVVLDAMDAYYQQTNANVHRGVHTLSEEATALYEDARGRIARFVHAPASKEIIFTRNATEAINLVAYSWGLDQLKPGDEVLITQMEHHANIVPWQLICRRTGATLRYVPIDDRGALRLDLLDELLTERTRLFAFVAMSNVLGTVNPVADLVARAHAVGALALVDGAQSVPHSPVDVQALQCDFLVFSGHKMCGPTGIGVLWGRREILESMPPFMGGGDMIREVRLEESRWNTLPWKFEAGTPAIAEVIGLGAAVDYLSEIGMDWVQRREHELVSYAMDRLAHVEGLHIIGPSADERGGAVAFTLGAIHPHDISAILDADGIAIRAGHHCAQPIHDYFGLPATARASFYFYNTFEEIDRLAAALEKAAALFAF